MERATTSRDALGPVALGQEAVDSIQVKQFTVGADRKFTLAIF